MDPYDKFILHLLNTINRENTHPTPDKYIKHLANDTGSVNNSPPTPGVNKDKYAFHQQADQAAAWRQFMEDKERSLMDLEINSGGDAGPEQNNTPVFTGTTTTVTPMTGTTSATVPTSTGTTATTTTTQSYVFDGCTQLVTTVSSGSSEIHIDPIDQLNFFIGMSLTIAAGSPTEETVSIQTVTGSKLTLWSPLQYAHGAGTVVCIYSETTQSSTTTTTRTTTTQTPYTIQTTSNASVTSNVTASIITSGVVQTTQATTQPASTVVTTQPATTQATTQPASTVVTTQPATTVVTTQPATAVTTQPATTVVTTQAETTAVTTQPATTVVTTQAETTVVTTQAATTGFDVTTVFSTQPQTTQQVLFESSSPMSQSSIAVTTAGTTAGQDGPSQSTGTTATLQLTDDDQHMLDMMF